MSESLQGGCQCGAVRYQIDAKPVALAVCHCTDCQKQSGSAFGMSLVVPRDAFSVSGETRTFTKIAESGHKVDCVFCPACGVRVFHRPHKLTDTLNVKPGTLDDTSALPPPSLSVWTRSRQPWVWLYPDAPAFERNPTPRG